MFSSLKNLLPATLAWVPRRHFGRPLKLKVNKFSAGALQKPSISPEAQAAADELERLESSDQHKKNGFRFDEIDDETNDQPLNKTSSTKSSTETFSETFKNPGFKAELKDQITDFESKEDPENELAELSNHASNKLLRKEDDKHFSKEKVQFIKDTLLYEGDDPYFQKLVNRPEKGVVWGLGGELLRQQKNFFEKGKFPSVEAVISFLELEQGKDIICVDLEKECNRYDLPRYGIILSSFSCRHNYKIASNLLRAIRDLQIPEMANKNFIISGRKDDEWLLVDFNNIAVHMFVEEAREEIDLEWKWRNPPTAEEIQEYEKIQRHKARKTFFEPLDDY